MGGVYRGLIAAAQSDTALSDAHLEQVIEPATVACRRRLALARERGEIRADVDDQTVIDMLSGLDLLPAAAAHPCRSIPSRSTPRSMSSSPGCAHRRQMTAAPATGDASVRAERQRVF